MRLHPAPFALLAQLALGFAPLDARRTARGARVLTTRVIANDLDLAAVLSSLIDEENHTSSAGLEHYFYETLHGVPPVEVPLPSQVSRAAEKDSEVRHLVADLQALNDELRATIELSREEAEARAEAEVAERLEAARKAGEERARQEAEEARARQEAEEALALEEAEARPLPSRASRAAAVAPPSAPVERSLISLIKEHGPKAGRALYKAGKEAPATAAPVGRMQRLAAAVAAARAADGGDPALYAVSDETPMPGREEEYEAFKEAERLAREEAEARQKAADARAREEAEARAEAEAERLVAAQEAEAERLEAEAERLEAAARGLEAAHRAEVRARRESEARPVPSRPAAPASASRSLAALIKEHGPILGRALYKAANEAPETAVPTVQVLAENAMRDFQPEALAEAEAERARAVVAAQEAEAERRSTHAAARTTGPAAPPAPNAAAAGGDGPMSHAHELRAAAAVEELERLQAAGGRSPPIGYSEADYAHEQRAAAAVDELERLQAAGGFGRPIGGDGGGQVPYAAGEEAPATAPAAPQAPNAAAAGDFDGFYTASGGGKALYTVSEETPLPGREREYAAYQSAAYLRRGEEKDREQLEETKSWLLRAAEAESAAEVASDAAAETAS